MRSSVRVSGCSVPDAEAASGQRDVERVGRELRRELRVGERRAACGERRPRAAALASLIRAPAAGRSRRDSLPSPFSCSVSAPALPR